MNIKLKKKLKDAQTKLYALQAQINARGNEVQQTGGVQAGQEEEEFDKATQDRLCS